MNKYITITCIARILMGQFSNEHFANDLKNGFLFF